MRVKAKTWGVIGQTKTQKTMCTHLLSNKWIKLALIISASLLFFQQALFAQSTLDFSR